MEPKVSIVFAAKYQHDADMLIELLEEQVYAGEIEYCYSTTGTISEAYNEALDHATGDIILFIETDAIPCSTSFISDMVASAQRGRFTKAVEVNQKNQNWAGCAIYKDDLHGERIDESYEIAEDTEFFQRLKRKHNVGYAHIDAVSVLHLKSPNTPKALERARRYGFLHAQLIAAYGYYPLSAYKQRMELQKQIAEETLKGIEEYEAR